MNDPLFDIIRSMSKNEKGFFKKASRLHSLNGDKAYLRLFDVIDQMNKFDEEKLKRKTSSFISDAMLPATKNYLKNALLKSLRQFKETISPEMEMNARLSNIEILFRSRLLDLCRKEISAAKRLIENAELFCYYHVIAYWEKQMLNDSERTHHYRSYSAFLMTGEAENVKRLLNLSLFERLAYQVYSITYTKGDGYDLSVSKQLDELMQSRVLESEDQALTLTTKIIYNNIHSKYAEVTGDLQRILFHLERVTTLFGSNPKFRRAHISKYMNALYNHAKAAAWAGDTVFGEQYEKLLHLPADFEITYSPVFIRVHRLLLMNLRMHKRSAERNIMEIKIELEEYRDNQLAEVPDGYALVRMEVQSFFAFSFFAAEQFRLALKWANTVLENKNLREDVVAYMRLMLLAIHYELENDVLLTSELKSVKRFLEKSGRMSGFENCVIDFVRLMISLRREEPAIRLKLQNVYIEALKQEPPVRPGKIHSSISLVNWMKQKLISLKETVSEPCVSN